MAILTENWTFDAVICILTAFLSFYFYMTRNFNYWKNRGVKQVDPVFFFGNIAACVFARGNPPQLISNVYKKGEDENMIGIYAFDKPYLVLRDPELIKDVFIKDFNNFSNKILTGNSTDVFGGYNLFLAKNPPWKHIRQKMSPVLSSGKIKNMLYLMLEICEEFKIHMDTYKIDDKIGKPVEVKEVLAKLMTDFIGTTAFGVKFNSLIDPDAEFRKYGRAMFQHSYKRYLQLIAIFFLPALRSITNAQFFDENGSKFFRKSFWDVINERKKSGIKRLDVIDQLMEIMKQQDDDKTDSFKLEGDALVSQAAVFFSGGFETTSTTSTFALHELAKNQEIQRRLRNEIVKGLEENGGKITYEMVMTLPYLNMVVHETMRKYPILPYLDRIPEKDYTFSGTNITITKGTPVIIPVRPIHIDPKYYPNPHKFDPKRFSEENRKNLTPYTYFPFGEGPRNCIGARLGLLQTKLALICFISEYELSFCQQTPDTVKFEHLSAFTQIGELYLNLRKISP